MSATPQPGGGSNDTAHHKKEQRAVVMAAAVGTTVEWYDFFIYAISAGVVFGELFFAPIGGQLGQILAFATIGISFIFRPLGAFIAGHLGDKYGRKRVLMLTLMLMGATTMLVGVLPTHASVGVWAPILLVLLRILQGVSAGGEWGGAALLAVEHAPVQKRGLFGTAPQIGVPIGLLLASGVLGIMAMIAPGDAFLAWGWRIPFLLSFVLIGIGYYVRRRVEESPVFEELHERREESAAPVATLLRHYAPQVLMAALLFAGNNAVGYMTTGGYIQRYATDPSGPIGLPTALVMWAVACSAIVWLVSTLGAGWLSDGFGRRRTYILGWLLQLVGVLALFPLLNIGTAAAFFASLALLSVGLGFTYGPQPSFYSELFPASIRFSGASISYALGAVVGGAFAPTIAEILVDTTGSTESVTWYLAAMTLVGLAASLVLGDRTGAPLGAHHEAEHAPGATYGPT